METARTSSDTQAVERFFNDSSAEYAELFLDKRTGKNFELRRRLAIVTAMAETVGGSLLECAAGTGEITAAILQTGRIGRATVLDLSPRMLESARRRIETAVGSAPRVDVEFICADIFTFAAEQPIRRFDLITCLGLIAHTGRLPELLSALRAMLSDTGAILLQSSLLDQWNIHLLRALSAERYYRRYGYHLCYFHHRDIVEAARAAGLHIAACRRYALGVPFGDRIWPWANYWLERGFQRWAGRYGAEAIYLLKPEHAGPPRAR